jgi:hypothetical protein
VHSRSVKEFRHACSRGGSVVPPSRAFATNRNGSTLQYHLCNCRRLRNLYRCLGCVLTRPPSSTRPQIIGMLCNSSVAQEVSSDRACSTCHETFFHRSQMCAGYLASTFSSGNDILEKSQHKAASTTGGFTVASTRKLGCGETRQNYKALGPLRS